MLFDITNLGPIRAATLDLSRDLIILTGPNNSGKTYLTWAIYALARANARTFPLADSLIQWAKAVFNAGDQGVPASTFWDLRDVALQALAASTQDQLPDDFAAPRERFKATQIRLSTSGVPDTAGSASFATSSGDFILVLVFSRTDAGARVRLRIRSKTADLTSNAEDGFTTPTSIPAHHRDALYQSIARLAISKFRSAWIPPTTALPVERLAINLFARELAANRTNLVDELLSATSAADRTNTLQDQLSLRANRYPRVIRDALQTALRLSRWQNVSAFNDLADELEQSILGGKISTTELEEIEFTPSKDVTSPPLGLHQSASVIKSLASLVLYLRFQAGSGQRLIIDEPELNLHPDNQRRIARVLAKAVNRGLKIILSTHSDYVIRELNNLIMLSQDSDRSRTLASQLGYDPQSLLHPDRLAVYLANEGECSEVSVKATGFEIKTIDDEIHRLNQDSQTIYLKLFCE